MTKHKCNHEDVYFFGIKGGKILYELVIKCYEVMWEEDLYLVSYTWVFIMSYLFSLGAVPNIPIQFVLIMAFDRGVLYGNVALPIVVLSTKKRYPNF